MGMGFFCGGTKGRVMKTAIWLIKQKGYDAVTVNDICAACGISKNTFYYHFKSKDDLLTGFYQPPAELMAEHVHSLLVCKNEVERIFGVFAPMVGFIADCGPEILRRIFVCALTGETERPGFRDEGVITRLRAEFIAKAQAAGEIGNQSDPVSLAEIIFHQILFAGMLWSAASPPTDFPSLVRRVIEDILDVKEGLRGGIDREPPE